MVGQGNTQEDAVNKLKEAIESFQSVYESRNNIHNAPISIEEMHEFLTLEDKQEESEIYELRKV